MNDETSKGITIQVNKDMMDILLMRKRLGPALLPIVFWVGAIVIILGGLKLFTTGGPILGLLLVVVLIPLLRILCEVLLEVFEISKAVTTMKKFDK